MSCPEVPADFYDPKNYRAGDSVGYLMRRTLQVLAQQTDVRLAEHDLTHAQWAPLFMLHRGGASTVATLAREMSMDAGAATRMLDRLEKKGFVRRSRSTEDRRVVRVELTDAGRVVAQRVPGVLAAVSNQLLAGFSREEWQVLLGLLRRMLANGEALKAPASQDEP